jgi:hypothetical protein
MVKLQFCDPRPLLDCVLVIALVPGARRDAGLVHCVPIEVGRKPMLPLPAPAARTGPAPARTVAGCGNGHDGEDRRGHVMIDQISIAFC